MERMQSKHPKEFKDQDENSTKWVRCTDDMVLWAESLEDSIRQTIIFFQECASEGEVFNKKKIKFACTEVEALGFNLTQEGIEPTKGYLNAQINYPVPKCLKDMRGFSGFFNQSAFMTKDRTKDAMSKLRHRLLKIKTLRIGTRPDTIGE